MAFRHSLAIGHARASWEMQYTVSGPAPFENEDWLRTGRLPNDQLPWLRSVQLAGSELPIIGASLEAVRVCVNSWHAGFKPVLIILEDQLGEKSAEVYAAIWKLEKDCFSRGMLQRGPVLISSNSDSCMVRLDDHGHIRGVLARTNAGGLHTVSECWQFFKGHALIIDTPEKGDGSGGLKLDPMTQTERTAVVESTFWCSRFDPECVPFWTTTYTAMVPNVLFGMLQMMVVTMANRFQQGPAVTFNLYRCLCDALLEIPCAASMTMLYSPTLGLQVQPHWPSRFTIAVGIGYWITQCVVMLPTTGNLVASDWVCSNVGITCWLFPMLLAFAKVRGKTPVTRHMLKWFATTIVCSFGAWNNVIFLLVIYLNLLDVQPVLASLFLSISFAIQEALLVKVVSVAYTRMVMELRKKTPMAIVGDQKLALSACIICIHTFTDLGRLLCIVVGAIEADGWAFIFHSSISFFSSCFMNCLFRTFWFECLLVRCLPHPRVKSLVCPACIDTLHNDTKFPMSWLKYGPVWGIFLGRGLIHDHWTGAFLFSNIPLQDNTVWCFNFLVLSTVLISMMAGLLEDFIVHQLQQAQPAPVWKVFGKQMISRFDTPEHEDLFHPDHLMVPVASSQEDTDDADESLLTSAREGRRRLAASVKMDENSIPRGLTSQGNCPDLLPPLSASPNLKHARTFHTLQLHGINGAALVLANTVLSVGLGHGVLYGHCLPSASRSPWTNLFVFQRTCPT